VVGEWWGGWWWGWWWQGGRRGRRGVEGLDSLDSLARLEGTEASVGEFHHRVVQHEGGQRGEEITRDTLDGFPHLRQGLSLLGRKRASVSPIKQNKKTTRRKKGGGVTESMAKS